MLTKSLLIIIILFLYTSASMHLKLKCYMFGSPRYSAIFVHYYNNQTTTHTRTLTWAAVGSQVAVAVSVAPGAAVDGAIVVIGAAVGPGVRKPGLGCWFTDIQ